MSQALTARVNQLETQVKELNLLIHQILDELQKLEAKNSE